MLNVHPEFSSVNSWGRRGDKEFYNIQRDSKNVSYD